MTRLPASASASPIFSFLSALQDLCFLYLALLPLSLCSAQGGLSSVVIYSASGCTDVSNVTVNCTFPAVITLETSGFGALQMISQYIVVSGPGAQLASFVETVGSPNQSDSVSFTLLPQGYTPSLIGGMLSIQLVDYAGNRSRPFAGMSLAPIAASRAAVHLRLRGLGLCHARLPAQRHRTDADRAGPDMVGWRLLPAVLWQRL